MIKVKDFLKVKDNFQYAINLKYDIDSIDKIVNYIITPGSIEIIEDVVMGLSSNSQDKAKILIGAYGKGKSHLILVILSLISNLNSESSKIIIEKIKEYNLDLYERLIDLSKDKFKLLPIVVTSSSLDMKQILLNSLMETLVNSGLGHIMPDSYYDSAVKTINMWQEDYPTSFTELKKHIDCDVNILISDLMAYKKAAYDKFIEVFPKVTAGSEFNPLFASDIDTIYSSVSKELIQYGYNGLYIVYDEFSKFLEGSIDKNSALDIKLLQDLAELCNRSTINAQIHLTLISHKDINSYTDSLPKEKIDSWKAVSERFKRIEINNSKLQTYHLINEVLHKDQTIFSKYIVENLSRMQKLENSFMKSGLNRTLSIDTKKFVESGIPLHPLTTLILPEISEYVAQNERTLFTFLASKEKRALNNLVAEGDSVFILTPDLIYDYFEEQFKKENFENKIYQMWRSSKELCNAIDVDETKNDDKRKYLLSKKIVKFVALIHMISMYEMIAPTSNYIDFAFEWNYSYDEVKSSIEYLIDKKFIRHVSMTGYYELRSTHSVDISIQLKNQISKRQQMFELDKTMKYVIDTEVVYPNMYNSEYEIIRYYDYRFMNANDFLNINDWNYYLSKQKNSGCFIIVLVDEEKDLKIVKKKVMDITHSLCFVAIPKKSIDFEADVRAVDALLNLIEINELNENDKVLKEEYLIELDEVILRLSHLVQGALNPEYQTFDFYCEATNIDIVKKSHLNNLLSKNMAKQFSIMPIINNEMINKDNISKQILNARSKIIDKLLHNEIKPDLGLVGHGPEVSIMRSTLINTGYYNGDKLLLSKNILDQNLKHVVDYMSDFLEKTSGSGKRSFGEFYDYITHEKNKIGMKLGVIPIYLAATIHKYKRYIVITKDSHELELTVAVINDINRYPQRYSVYLEEWNEDKEEYIKGLENLFTDYIEEAEKEYNSFDYVLKGIHRWFLYLPKYSKEYKKVFSEADVHTDASKESVRLRQSLRGSRFNSRDFIFVRLPKIYGLKNYSNQVIENLKETRKEIDSFLNTIRDNLADALASIFTENKDKTLYSAIHEWYEDLEEVTKCNRFDNGEEVLMNSIDYISNNHYDFIDLFSREIIGLSISDWDDDKYVHFYKRVKNFKKSIDQFNKRAKENGVDDLLEDSYTISFKTESGDMVNSTFKKSGLRSDQANVFYDELSGLLEDYEHTLEKSETRQVLMEILKKVL